MLIRTDTLQPWRGERLSNGILYPKNIEQLWPVTDLLEIGLVVEIKFVLLTGWHFTGSSTWDITGQEFRPTEQIPPPTQAELDEDDAHELDFIFSKRVLLKILFNLAKETSPTLTKAQFRTWIEGLE